ncbi:ParB/RepB/Spo0J family partition protein [Oscillospiraceae bacterium LCP25S3_F9]
MAINIDNLNAAFDKANTVAKEINKISHSETVKLDLIFPSEYNPYNEFDEVNDNEIVKQLADSILVQGLIEPIVLNKVNDDRYIILSGERRFKAVSLLGWKAVNAQVYDNLDNTTAQLVLHSSNLEVREYTSGQKLVFYKDVKGLLAKMKDEGKISGGLQKAIANMLHINDRQVRKYERICSELSEQEQKQIIDNKVSINDGYKLAQQRKNENKKSCEVQQQRLIEPTEKEDTEDKIKSSEVKQLEQTNSFDEENTSNEESVLSYIYRLFGRDKLLNYYKNFIPTENEASEFFFGCPILGLRSAVSIDKDYQTITINGKAYYFSEIDMLIRNYIRTGVEGNV